MIDRRALLRLTGLATVAPVIGRPGLAARADGEQAVVVRLPDSRVMALTRDGLLPARWQAIAPEATPVARPVPEELTAITSEGAVGYWLGSPDGRAAVLRIDSGETSRWWWRGPDTRARQLDLPPDLEPARPSGSTAAWFHGATVDAAHLGAGTLRLLAVELARGAVVLDETRDRRLELAATAVSLSGAIVGHVQAANTGVSLWAADLRHEGRVYPLTVTEAPTPASASAVRAVVAEDGERALLAAELVRSDASGERATVHAMWGMSRGRAHAAEVTGELLGIVPRAQALG